MGILSLSQGFLGLKDFKEICLQSFFLVYFKRTHQITNFFNLFNQDSFTVIFFTRFWFICLLRLANQHFNSILEIEWFLFLVNEVLTAFNYYNF